MYIYIYVYLHVLQSTLSRVEKDGKFPEEISFIGNAYCTDAVLKVISSYIPKVNVYVARMTHFLRFALDRD
jgi:hypothetical protein